MSGYLLQVSAVENGVPRLKREVPLVGACGEEKAVDLADQYAATKMRPDEYGALFRPDEADAFHFVRGCINP